MKNYPASEIKALIEKSSSLLLVVPSLNIDSAAAALSFAILLEKKGKQVTLYSPTLPDENLKHLEFSEKISNKYNVQSDFTITLNYPLDQIERVTYNDDGGQGNIIVQTKKSAPSLSSTDLSFTKPSQPFDLGIMIGEETSLPDTTTLLSQGSWIYFSNQNAQKPWAKLSLFDKDAPFCEIMSFLLPQIGLTLDSGSGKNLLIGLRWSTQSFSVNVNPDTFEAGSLCLAATQAHLVKEQQSSVTSPSSWTPATSSPQTTLDSVETLSLSTENKEGVSATGTEGPIQTPPILKGSTTPRS